MILGREADVHQTRSSSARDCADDRSEPFASGREKPNVVRCRRETLRHLHSSELGQGQALNANVRPPVDWPPLLSRGWLAATGALASLSADGDGDSVAGLAAG